MLSSYIKESAKKAYIGELKSRAEPTVGDNIPAERVELLVKVVEKKICANEYVCAVVEDATGTLTVFDDAHLDKYAPGTVCSLIVKLKYTKAGLFGFVEAYNEIPASEVEAYKTLFDTDIQQQRALLSKFLQEVEA